MGEKRVREATGCILRLNLGKSQCFGLAFHSMVTLHISYYALPDTGVSDLQLVAVEYLPSIEGAVWICQTAPFCGEVFCFLRVKAFPYEGKVARRRP